jgi:ABC-2 type transport system permease protein
MNAALSLFQNELDLYRAELRRHYLEPIGGLVLVSALFLGLYYGVRAVALAPAGSAGTSASLDGLLVGYFSWGVAGAAYNSIARHIAQESQTGTLEQLFLSPHRFSAIMVSRASVHMLSGLGSTAAMALIAMLCTGRWLHLPLGHTVALLLLASVSLVGVGLAVGGVVLIYKRLSAIASLLNLLLLVVVSVPARSWTGLGLLPFAYGASTVRALAAGHASASLATYALVAANSLVYLVAGLWIFRRFERYARRGSLLGTY